MFFKKWSEDFAMLPRLPSNLWVSCLSLPSNWDHGQVSSLLAKRATVVKWTHSRKGTRLAKQQQSDQDKIGSAKGHAAVRTVTAFLDLTPLFISGLDKSTPVKCGTGEKKVKPLSSEGFREGWGSCIIWEGTLFIWPLDPEPGVHKNYKSLEIHLEL